MFHKLNFIYFVLIIFITGCSTSKVSQNHGTNLMEININKLGSPIIIEDLIKNFILENEVINGSIILKIDEIKNNKLIDDLYMLLNLNFGKISFEKSLSSIVRSISYSL